MPFKARYTEAGRNKQLDVMRPVCLIVDGGVVNSVTVLLLISVMCTRSGSIAALYDRQFDHLVYLRYPPADRKK